MKTKAAPAPEAQRYPSAPTAEEFDALLDYLGDQREQALARVDRLKVKKRELETEIHAAEADAERVEVYVFTQLERLGLDATEGEEFQSRLSWNSRVSFEVLGDPAKLPPKLRKVKYSLDDKAALAAHAAGTLPKMVKATLGRHVRIERVRTA